MTSTTTELVWRVAVGLRRFTTQDLMQQAGASRSLAEGAVRRLRLAGLVTRVEGENRWSRNDGRLAVYEIAPGVSGGPPPPCLLPARHLDMERAWAAMRMMREFSAVDLVATASISYENARKLSSRLAAAGILRRLGRRQPPGQPGSYLAYRLVRDLGPVPPAQMSRRARPGADSSSGDG